MKRQHVHEYFSRWLRRFAPPKNIQTDEQAMQDEANALLGVLVKFAPDEGYESWLARVLTQLEYQMKTRAWPTVGEVGAVARNVTRETPKAETASARSRLDPVAMAAKRIDAGEAIGEQWLFGVRAVALLRSGRVSRERLRDYRSGWFSALREVVGEARAHEIERAMKAKHARAAEDRGGERFERELEIPDLHAATAV